MTPAQIAHRDRIVARFAKRFADKYQRGQQEHGGNMWSKPGMLPHAIEEVVDLVAYLFTLEEQLRPALADASLPPVVYLAGPFRSRSKPYSFWEQQQHVNAAAALALEAWRLGVACVCPHLNTAPFQGAADDAIWLAGDLAILARCDALLLMPDWAASSGATAERDYAIRRGLPVLASIEALEQWLEDRAAQLSPLAVMSYQSGSACE